ncbi:alpha/beta fold hydrolase [Brevibacillus sp. 179-C9.3 HS]|uniref:alpha/beta fold hydrolase n=1 Tax=unclassified Brevibacillus TaxID=2684853 RepID=UPI00399F2F5E
MEQVLVHQDGKQFAFHMSGKGTPLVCIHAPCIGSINFVYQQSLTDTYQLIVPDLPGHGDTSPMEKPFSIGELAEQLHKLIPSLGIERPFIMGYSQGASIALEYCLRYPDHVRGAILVSAFSEVHDLYLHGRFLMARALSMVNGVPLLARSIASSHIDDQEMRTQWIQHASKTDSASLKYLYAAGHRYQCTERLGNIQLPILLAYGKQDQRMHPYAQMLTMRLPNAQLVMIPNVKHQIITKAASDFNQLCRTFMQEM